MAASYPPPPPSPPRSNDTLLAVVIGIVAVLVLMIAFGVFVIGGFLRGTHIVQRGNGNQQTVDIHSPLGDLHVDKNGNQPRVSIRSPFGNLDVNPTPDIGKLGMAIYPGAALVTSRTDSPFHHMAGDRGLDDLGGEYIADGNATGAQVEMSSAGAALEVNVAEFRTPATPDQVLAYYSSRLAQFGPVERKHQDGAVTLEVRLSHKNVRAAAVKPGPDGTHFVLVRAVGDAAAK